jgi:hypothetical protein
MNNLLSVSHSWLPAKVQEGSARLTHLAVRRFGLAKMALISGAPAEFGYRVSVES